MSQAVAWQGHKAYPDADESAYKVFFPCRAGKYVMENEIDIEIFGRA